MKRLLLNTWYGIKELYYWFKLIKVINKNKSRPDWKRMNFRIGWVYQIYTVINLKDEYMGEEEDVKKMRVLEKIAPINKYVASLSDFVKDSVRLEIVHEPNTKSWVVIYWPLFNYFSLWWVLKRIIIGFSAYFIIKWSIIYIIPFLIETYNNISNYL